MTSSALDDDTMRLRIKSFKDVEISVPAGSVVAHLKQQVKAALLDAEESQDRYLRLICKGRLLLPDDHPISDFNVQDGDVVHAVLAPPTAISNTSTNNGNNNNNEQAKVAQSSERTRRRHLVVGPGGRVTRASRHDESDDEESLVSGERRGFDRLRLPDNGISAVPLSRAEVTALRLYFSRNIDRYLVQHPGNPEEDPMLRRYQAEEEWMSHQGPASEFRLNVSAQNLFLTNSTTMARGVGTAPVGTDRDFMWGFMLGFFVGFVMLFWVWIPTVPHKQKIGILTGITFQLALNVLAGPEEKQEEDAMDD